MWYNLCTRNISYTTSNWSGCMNSDAKGSWTLACESFLFKHSFTFPHYTSFVLFALAIFASDPMPWHRSRRYRCCRSISRVCQSLSYRDIGPWCTLQIWWISQVWTSLGSITVTTKFVSYSSFSSSNEIDITSLTLNTACSWMTTYFTIELDSNHPKLCGLGRLWVLDQTRREGKPSMGVMEALILLWEKCFLHLLLTFSIFPPLHWVLFSFFCYSSNFFNFPTIFTIIHQFFFCWKMNLYLNIVPHVQLHLLWRFLPLTCFLTCSRGSFFTSFIACQFFFFDMFPKCCSITCFYYF